MATPAAILSLLVQTQGVQTATAQIRSVDKAGKSAGGSMSALEKSTKRTSKTFSLLGSAAKTVGPLLGAVGVAKAVSVMNDEFREAQKVGAQTTAVLKSTGGAAKVTQKHIENLAGAISAKAGIDDEAIQSGENLLLTFTKIRNETGKGNKIFDQATQTITDMSVALGQDMKSSAIQVGKALNDPVKGVTALQRVGVSFTKTQKDQIKGLVEHGKTLEAQKLILRELTKEFGGSAAAQATAGDKLKVSLGNLAEAAGGILVPQLDKAAKFMSKMIDEFIRGEGIAKVIIPAFFATRDAVVDLVAALAPLVPFFESLPQPVKVATAAMAAFALVFAVSGPLGLGLTAFAVTAILIKRNWSTVGPVLQSVGQIASTVFGALATAVDAVKTAFQATVGWVKTAMDNTVKEIHKWDVAIAVVKAALTALKVFLAPALAAITILVKVAMTEIPIVVKTVWGIVKAEFTGAWTALKGIVEGGLQAIRGVIKIIGGIFKGDFGQIWDGIKDVFKGALKALEGLVKGAAQTIGGAAEAIGKGIADGVIEGLGQLGHLILQKFKEAVNWIKDKIPKVHIPLIGDIGGDGLGRGSTRGSAALKGARAAMQPFANIGASHGLSVTSGLRPGAITSSGNPSWHGTGEAIDMAGSPGGMMATFRDLKSRFGGRLAELIYTPGGVGIKNGQPFRYSGQVAADHLDHVHVAFDSGRPGLGDGIGRLRSAARTGDGIGQIKALWTRAGGSPAMQNMAAAIAMAESGGNPNISHKNADGSVDRGLWQINSVHGALSTFDRLGNARAAVQISGNGSNWNPWTVFRTGAYKRYLGAADKAKNKSGGASKGKSVPTLTGGANIPTKPATYDQITAALDLAVTMAGGPDNPAALGALIDRRRALSERATKIRKALAKKGLRPETRARLQTELSGLITQAREMDTQISTLANPAPADTGEDPNQPLIDAQNAAAEAAQRLADQLQGVKDEIKRQTDFATSVANTSNFQLTKSLADLLSGQIVGYGVAGRAFTPGTGVEVAF